MFSKSSGDLHIVVLQEFLPGLIEKLQKGMNKKQNL